MIISKGNDLNVDAGFGSTGVEPSVMTDKPPARLSLAGGKKGSIVESSRDIAVSTPVFENIVGVWPEAVEKRRPARLRDTAPLKTRRRR
jgi:hypothetical protein